MPAKPSPCPFCKGEAHVSKNKYYFIVWHNEGCYFSDSGKEVEEIEVALLSKWNKRAKTTE